MKGIEEFNQNEELTEELRGLVDQILTLLEEQDVPLNTSLMLFGILASLVVDTISEDFKTDETKKFREIIAQSYQEMILND